MTELLLDADRLRGSPPEELLSLLQSCVAESVALAAGLALRLESEGYLAARCRQLASELTAITHTPLPQATKLLSELRADVARMARDRDDPQFKDYPFRGSWERSVLRHQEDIAVLEKALAGFNSSQTVPELRQALLTVFSWRCRAAAWFRLASEAAAGGERDRALERLTSALECDPGFAAAYCCRGLHLVERKEYGHALADLGRAIELEPSMAAAYRHRGTALRNLQEHGKALADFEQALKLDPHSSAAFAGRGIVHRALGENEKALADLNRAIELDRSNFQAFNNRANALWGKGEHDRALEDYNRALELNPRYVQALNNRGNLFRDLKEYDRALADFARALEIDPVHTYVFNNRGNVYADLKQYDLSLADYGRAIELDPGNADARNNRGIIHTEMGRPQQALEDFNRAIELDPRHASSYSNRAMIYTDMGKEELAIADYSRAIVIKPGDSVDHLNLSELYLVGERYQNLLACLQQADPYLNDDGDRLVLCYMRSIAQRMLKMDSRESDLCFERILGRVQYVSWSFDAIDAWLGRAFIEDGQRQHIERLTKLLKGKTKL